MLYSGPPLRQGVTALVSPSPALVRQLQTDQEEWGRWLEQAIADDGIVYFSIQQNRDPVGEIFLHDIDAAAATGMLGYHIFRLADRGAA